MASVAAKKVFKNYGDVAVVHGIDLDIEDGSFVVLLGPSGCGKSTLLRMIAGLETVTKGDIEIGGKRVNEVHPKDRNIAMVFQNYALYAHMNVADNMSFSLKLAKRPRAEIDEKVKWAARILNLEPYLKRYPRELSGGQRQRVAMGRAIVRDPAVFLFDEPLSNLDAKLRVQMRTEIKELHERLRTTTVYVTHDQIEAMTMADKIVILRDGRIEQIGSPLEVYDRPANLFVAAFIGSPAMNLLKGETVAAEGGTAVRSGDVLLPLPKSAKAQAGRSVIYGVRPEHLDPVMQGGGLPATVSVTEPTGPEIHVYAELAGEEVCAITDERLDWKRGGTIGLKPRLDRVHLFDAQSGQAIL
ncbi:MAG: ABC transporter ATP-binding protein [Parvibaculaceae bacterium]